VFRAVSIGESLTKGGAARVSDSGGAARTTTHELDTANEAQRNLEESVWELTRFNSKEPWTYRKLHLIDNAKQVFIDKCSAVVDPSTVS
jgi:hypothetical protein